MKRNKGFTLIELVVVMAIIAVLSTIIVGAILAARKAANNTQKTGVVRTVETALEARASRCNGFYYADLSNTSYGNACKAIDMSKGIQGLINQLEGKDATTGAADATRTKYLTQDVVIDSTSATNYAILDSSGAANSSPSNNGYMIETCDGVCGATGVTIIYSATR
jgi:prepilin-type N-terminal cleavage/methylation domain-containing protein